MPPHAAMTRRRLLGGMPERLARGDQPGRRGRVVVPRDPRPAGIGHRAPAATGAHAFEREREIVHVAGAMHFSGLAGDHEIRTTADVIADDGRETGGHGFVDDQAP